MGKVDTLTTLKIEEPVIKYPVDWRVKDHCVGDKRYTVITIPALECDETDEAARIQEIKEFFSDFKI